MENWKLDHHGVVALATFTRPPRNLMDTASMTELEELLKEVVESEAVVVVMTGGVDGYFIAHADLEDLQKFARREQVDGDPRSWGRVPRLLEEMPQPVIAAINGQAWGGGCEVGSAEE